LFAPLKEPTSWWKIILWWEIRRIPYNIIVGVAGFVGMAFYLFAIDRCYGPEVDVDFFLIIWLGGLGANFAYTFGWLFDLLFLAIPGSRGYYRSHTAFKYGLLLSVLVVSFQIVMGVLVWVTWLLPLKAT
jgi:hypothetical protein